LGLPNNRLQATWSSRSLRSRSPKRLKRNVGLPECGAAPHQSDRQSSCSFIRLPVVRVIPFDNSGARPGFFKRRRCKADLVKPSSDEQAGSVAQAQGFIPAIASKSSMAAR